MLKKIALLLLAALACLSIQAASKHRYTLVIDAGHGGKDAGACANGGMEKNINLNVALAFGRYVEKYCPDVRVIYTRKTDVFIPLKERANIANKNKADVFISVHTNSLPSKKTLAGLETYTMGIRRSDEKLSAAKRENEVILMEDNYRQHYAGYDPHSPESMIIFEYMNELNMVKSVELAQLIQKHVCNTAGRPNHGVKQDAFLVLRETSMPACLVELGYITTPAEKAYLTNSKNVEAMGLGLYKAFAAYKNQQTGSRTPIAEPPLPEEKPVAAQPESKPAQPESKPAQPEPKPEQPVTKPDSAVSEAQEAQPVPQKARQTGEKPVFKVQIYTSDRQLKKGDTRLKGLQADCYKERGIWKYTVGASTNYNEIYRLRKQVLDKFPQAFIIAFRGEEKIDVNEAIREFKKNK